LRAGLVARAEEWRWGSLARRRGLVEGPTLSAGPLALPVQWLRHVNAPQTEAELEALRRCIQRGRPYGSEAWVQATCKAMNLESTLVPRGRPRVRPRTDDEGEKKRS
jgi:putative transposase